MKDGDGMGRNGMGRDGMGRDGMGWDGMGLEGMGLEVMGSEGSGVGRQLLYSSPANNRDVRHELRREVTPFAHTHQTASRFLGRGTVRNGGRGSQWRLRIPMAAEDPSTRY